MDYKIKEILTDKTHTQILSFRAYMEYYTSDTKSYYTDISYVDFQKAKRVSARNYTISKKYRGDVFVYTRNEHLDKIVIAEGVTGKLYSELEMQAKECDLLRTRVVNGTQQYSIEPYMNYLAEKSLDLRRGVVENILRLTELNNYEVLSVKNVGFVRKKLHNYFIVALKLPADEEMKLMCDDNSASAFCSWLEKSLVDKLYQFSKITYINENMFKICV